MNLKEQKRKLIIFFILCLCILGLFILIVSKSNSSSAVQHVHNWKYTYDESNNCCYKYCTEPGCTEKQTQSCVLKYYHSGNLEQALQYYGIDRSVYPDSLSDTVCYPICENCKNINSNGKFVCRTALAHDYKNVPESDYTDDEKINSQATCIHPAQKLEMCSRCSHKNWIQDGNSTNPDNHITYVWQVSSEKHWKRCPDCKKIISDKENHTWVTTNTKILKENSYEDAYNAGIDLGTVKILSQECQVCKTMFRETVDNPKQACPNSPNGYHKWIPETHIYKDNDPNETEGECWYLCDYGCGSRYRYKWER